MAEKWLVRAMEVKPGTEVRTKKSINIGGNGVETYLGENIPANLTFVPTASGAMIGIRNPVCGQAVLWTESIEQERMVPDQLYEVGHEPVTIIMGWPGQVNFVFLDPGSK